MNVKKSDQERERPPDWVDDGLEVYVHHVPPTPADERRSAQFWRQMMALVQKRQEVQKRTQVGIDR